MIYNDDGTFTWENEDILTAERMNKLLSQDDCGIIFLEVKKEGQSSTYYIEASYNDLKNWMEENKIICLMEMGNDTESQYQFFEYTLLEQLLQQTAIDDISYTAYFKNNKTFVSSDPDTNLIKIGAA